MLVTRILLSPTEPPLYSIIREKQISGNFRRKFYIAKMMAKSNIGM